MSRTALQNDTAARRGLALWRMLLLILASGGFGIFFLPTIGGILNLANLSAMGFFVLLGCISLFWRAFFRLLSWLWKRTWGKSLLLLSGVGVSVLIGLLLVLCAQVVSKLQEKPESFCPTLIVLGCQVQGERPSLMLRYRIEEAGAYLEENPGAVAILSGGQGPGEAISEAECMYRTLTQMGIDPARLYREEASTATLENLRFSMQIMEREGLETPVALVSNDFHVYRALKMAKDLDLPAQGLAAKSEWWFSRPTFVLREAMAMVKYALVQAFD